MKKILIVEDDQYVSQLYKIKLEALGYEVYLLETGEGVVDFVIQNKIDAIILDIILPKKDGVAVHTDLKANDQTKNIPVFILSVVEDGMVTSRLKQDGISELKSKLDTSFEDVVVALSKLLA